MALLKDGIYSKSGVKHPPFWQSALSQLKDLTTVEQFQTWLIPLEVASFESSELCLRVPSPFYQMYIKNNFERKIADTIKLITGNTCAISYKIGDSAADSENVSQLPQEKAEIETKQEQVEIPFSDSKEILNNSSFDSLVSDNGLIKTAGRYIDVRHNFDSFIVGAGNQFAFATGKSIAMQPGKKHNPLLLYGPSGLGKTHLLHAIAIEAYQANPSAKICYLSAENFVNDFIEATQRKSMNRFQSRYRSNFDIFLIDDIQFFASKDRSQEEFFHTFNHLCESHQQVVMTSDKAPKELAGLQSRLITRLQQGLIVDIKPPDLETRIAILKAKAEEDDLYLPDDVGLMIASNIRSNVRELEGSLVRLGAEVSINGTEISIEMAREALSDIFNNNKSEVLNVETIKNSVCQYYRISLSELESKSRSRKFAEPRQIAMCLCRKYAEKTYPEIASAFGGKDHTTVIHAIKKVDKNLQSSTKIKAQIEEIQQLL